MTHKTPHDDTVKLQVPISRDVRDAMERRAYELGFDSLQAYFRFWAKAEVDGRKVDLAKGEHSKITQPDTAKITTQPSVPGVRFYFNPQLFISVSEPIDKLQNPNESKLKSPSEYEELTKDFEEAWRESGDKRLAGIQEALGLAFNKPVLDVTVTPFVRPNNRPLIVNSRNNPDRTVDVITHEMVHELLEDNQQYQLFTAGGRDALTGLLRGLFGDLPPNTLHHIVVHAVLKHVFLEVLDERFRLERDIEESRNYMFGDYYVQAWDYVEAHDYEAILQSLRAELPIMRGFSSLDR